ncbi:urease accessory protein UreF [Zavarzinia compransoris]|uniref:Urease accessory protein UreF n=2 Tax=Zavarzinia compransoris TaxID=1264899 RepID=A0A317E0F5_9PROT|nr:urease accessory protein UreF [Zavarzinia compransoris]
MITGATITTTAMCTGRTASMTTEGALYRLMAWLSPAYPVGAFTHSHGLEWAIECGWVRDRAALIDWLEQLLTAGSGWNDAVFFAHAHGAGGDGARLAAIAELARANAPARERQVETLAQGTAFRLISENAWPADVLAALPADVAYPVAVGALAAAHDVPLRAALTAYLHGFAANLVSAAQRLVPLGQTDAQRAIAALMPVVETAAGRAAALDPAADPFAALGGATLVSDLCAMRHETQYTRLFRT